jgi:hypothetical protein
MLPFYIFVEVKELKKGEQENCLFPLPLVLHHTMGL